MNKLILILLVAVAIGCTNPSQAREVLADEGYTDIEMTGYRFFGCSDDDEVRDGFRARRDGRVVEGVVCCGLLFKDCTVRR